MKKRFFQFYEVWCLFLIGLIMLSWLFVEFLFLIPASVLPDRVYDRLSSSFQAIENRIEDSRIFKHLAKYGWIK